MPLTYKQLDKKSVLSDLIKINSDRMMCYEFALKNVNNIDIKITKLFEQIIADTKICEIELTETIKLTGKNISRISGIIYRTWMDLKVRLIDSNRTFMINSCLYNEGLALYTYKAALDLAKKIDDDIRTIILRQQATLKNTYEKVKSYKEVRHFSDSVLTYFN